MILATGPALTLGAPGDGPAGLYGPDSVAWRLNREAMLLLGAGPRALLLQIAHPLVAEGVDQHSTFREDPWARLRATLRSYLRIIYGSSGAARAEIRRLNELHVPIAGEIRDPEARARFGGAYRARDPELSLWVHATLVDSTLAAYERWLAPLPPAERAAYYAETVPIGRAFGVPESLLPADLASFEAYFERMLAPDGPIQVTATARELAVTILHPPLGPLVPALARVPTPLYDWTMWPALGLLPPRIREAYAGRGSTTQRAVAAWLLAGWQGWRPVLPRSFRQMPQALAADRRMAAATLSTGSGSAAGTPARG
jgi:uncharacterized protein (DUF2236 family)